MIFISLLRIWVWEINSNNFKGSKQLKNRRFRNKNFKTKGMMTYLEIFRMLIMHRENKLIFMRIQNEISRLIGVENEKQTKIETGVDSKIRIEVAEGMILEMIIEKGNIRQTGAVDTKEREMTIIHEINLRTEMIILLKKREDIKVIELSLILEKIEVTKVIEGDLCKI